MALKVFREYRGEFQLVGAFDAEIDTPSTAWKFAYAHEYLEREDAKPLSHSLPLRSDAFERREYQGFFEGLAPEGRMRTELAHRHHVSPSDYLGLLVHLGSECVGAIGFHAGESGIDELVPRYRPISVERVNELCEEPVHAVAAEMSATRLSLAGAQSKVGLYIEPGQSGAIFNAEAGTWHEPTGTAPSTHILKVADADGMQIAANEFACMSLARACGLETSGSAIVKDHDQLFISERYDRWFSSESTARVDGHPVPWRLHQEDFCQALGWPSYLKYELEDTVCYAISAGALIAKVSADPIRDKRKFANITLFNYFVGNCDNHLKNHSFLYSPSWDAARLAPLYDAVCTTVLGYDRKMGISIGDHQVIDEITFGDWELFGEDLRLGKGVIRRLYNDMMEQIRACAPDLQAQLPERAAIEFDRIMGDADTRMNVWK